MQDDEQKAKIEQQPIAELEAALSAQRVAAVQEAEIAALDRMVTAPGTDEGVAAIIAGAAPDDAARMEARLGLRKPSSRPKRTTNELADDWRSGGLSIQA